MLIAFWWEKSEWEVYLIEGKGLKCIVNGSERDTTYGHDDDMQGVEMHFQSP